MSAFSLEKEPFPVAAVDEFYFSTPALAARREELGSAIENGHVLLVDQEASGKTTMLDDFAEAVGERWRVFRLSADERTSAKDFVRALVEVFGLPSREPPAAALRDADALLELFTGQSRLAVIVVDDAHRLEPDALEQLLYLVKRWAQYSVRFLICAEPCLLARLEAIEGGERLPGCVAIFDMPRFDHEQVSDYLHLCLFRAGLTGDSPFDPEVVAMVTQRADGLVGAIDPIARELLASASTEVHHGDGRSRRGRKSHADARRWSLAVVIAAGIGVLLSVVAPGSATSALKAHSQDYSGAFKSSITPDPRSRSPRSRLGSASTDTLAR
jgi:type II secretory pathway predicted ATPase ExeA